MMICPVCTIELAMTERQGVEVDYCPQCRGIWLDRGELEKLIERLTAIPYQRDEYRSEFYDRQRHEGGHREEQRRHQGYERRGNHHEDRQHRNKRDTHHGGGRAFLSDLFDF